MKKDIHPKYKQVTVTCVTCGNTFETGSVLGEIRVDTCNHCHPFFTGKDRSTKADGRVDRFTKRYANVKK
jgi:large subunit ribosomal protein L31